MISVRRKIPRFSVTRHPSPLWIVQQLREAWPYASTHKFLLFDHDSKFGKHVVAAVRQMGSEPVRTAYRSPWQNGSTRKSRFPLGRMVLMTHTTYVADCVGRNTPAASVISSPSSDHPLAQTQAALALKIRNWPTFHSGIRNGSHANDLLQQVHR